jgi:hypothetical protein
MAMWNQLEPVEKRRLSDTGIDQDRAQPRTAVGERGQLGLLGPADLLEAAPDQRLDPGVGPGDRGEDLPGAGGRLDVAQADLQMPQAVLTAADKGRIHGQGDRRGCGCRLDRGSVDQVRADLERAGAQGLGVDPGIDRQKVLEHTGRDAVRHEGRKMCPDLIEFGSRAAMRRPPDTSLRPAATGTAKAWQSNRDLAEQGGDLVRSVVLDLACCRA